MNHLPSAPGHQTSLLALSLPAAAVHWSLGPIRAAAHQSTLAGSPCQDSHQRARESQTDGHGEGTLASQT